MAARYRSLASVVLVALASTRTARADVDVSRLFSERSAERAVPRFFGSTVSAVTELLPGRDAPPGFVAIGRGAGGGTIGIVDLGAGELSSFAREHPDLALEWAPPRRMLLDRADGLTRASSFRNTTGLTGRGVVIGIVDTGVDPTHPDLQGPSGSRIRYWLDFSRERRDIHPGLEDELGCRVDPNDETAVPCAVFDGDDVRALLENRDPDDDLRDPVGHGTHVASLAAGSGLADSPPRYVGVAPEASFVVVRVTRRGGGIFDADVLKATRFVFDRAEELGMPAVVNLSLGGDIGGHDGSAAVERGLSSLVGEGLPGRAIVVAAGNSAGLFSGLVPELPGPLGIHTEVHVPDGSLALVPIVAPETEPGRTEGTIFAWIAARPGDALSIGVEDRSGLVTPMVPPGASSVVNRDGVEITIANQVALESDLIPRGSPGALVAIDGAYPSTTAFGLLLEGQGTARIWVEGDGLLNPTLSIGPLLPRAQKAGTVGIPASAPGLIAVGATLNRTEWVDHTGETVHFPEHGALDAAQDDTTAYFSGAGPVASFGIKPDLVAPGANVIGAMAKGVDPRASRGGGLFDAGDLCLARGLTKQCFVADDHHVVTSGTSMAAPLVAGAVALLFERDPTLDQTRIKALLQAGSRPLRGAVFAEQQVGPGALDLEATLEALDLDAGGGRVRSPGRHSRLVLADSIARPDESWPLAGLALLRDDDGHVADGFTGRLELLVDGGSLSQGLERIGPGLFRFGVATAAGTGGRTLALSLRYDGRPLVEKSVPIAVDHALAAELPVALGGCSVARASKSAASGASLVLLALWAFRARRRRPSRRVARTGLHPGRTDGRRPRARCAPRQ